MEKPKFYMITVQIDSKQKEVLDKRLDGGLLNRSEYIRRILEEHFKNKDKKTTLCKV